MLKVAEAKNKKEKKRNREQKGIGLKSFLKLYSLFLLSANFYKKKWKAYIYMHQGYWVSLSHSKRKIPTPAAWLAESLRNRKA